MDCQQKWRNTSLSSLPADVQEAIRRRIEECGGEFRFSCRAEDLHIHDGALRGVHTKLDVLWRWEATEGTGDTHLAVYRGSKSRVEVRQGKEENNRPELYVVSENSGVIHALRSKVAALARQYPGVGIEDQGAQFRVTIPDLYRVGHEAHFGQVTNHFFRYVTAPESMPAWETPYMLAKYYVSTKGVEMGVTQ